MSAADHTNDDQFGQVLNEAVGLPPAFGTQPIPPGAVRVQHHTWSKNVDSIKEQGLRRDMASPHSESPQVFATTGDKLEHPIDPSGDRTVVEGYAFPHRMGDQMSQLDIGTGMSPERAASQHSTVTFHGDLPPSQILAVHEPWHEQVRYFTGDKMALDELQTGTYDNFIEDKDYPHIGRAVRALKDVL